MVTYHKTIKNGFRLIIFIYEYKISSLCDDPVQSYRGRKLTE
jgi:hypothetical protein